MTRSELRAGRRTILLPCLAIIGISSSAVLAQTVVINEVVTDPQQDWNERW